MDTDECSSSSEDAEMLTEIDFLQYCNNTVFVDLRGFQSHFGRFICKEFCLIDNSNRIYHQFIKSPFPITKLRYFRQVKAEWEQHFGHRIPYDYGDINIIELITDTHYRLNNKTVLVGDKFDQRNLKYIFRNSCNLHCITLNELNYDESLISEKLNLLPFCDFHNSVFGWKNGPCAKNIALRLRYIFTESQKSN